jgi:hypothetical protein
MTGVGGRAALRGADPPFFFLRDGIMTEKTAAELIRDIAQDIQDYPGGTPARAAAAVYLARGAARALTALIGHRPAAEAFYRIADQIVARGVDGR